MSTSAVSGWKAKGPEGPVGAPSSLPPLDLLDRAVLGFAAWTLSCHLVGAAGGSLRVSVGGFGVLVAAGLLLWRRLDRRGAGVVEMPEAPVDGGARSRALRGRPRIAGGLFLLATPVLLTWLWASGQDRWAWGGSILWTAVLLGREIGRSRPAVWIAEAPRWLLPTLAVFACLATAVLVRPDADDAFYLHLAVDAGDHPTAPLLLEDHLAGVPGLPLAPWHRLRSWELLLGALGWLTPLSPIDWSHRLLGPFCAILAVLAWRRLLRILVPDRWPAALAVIVAACLTVGDGHAGWFNFAFVRLHQGKGIFLTVLVPTILAYALERSRSPGPRSWILLAAAQVAATGLTPTAALVAPAVAILASLAGGTRRIVVTIAASLYPVVLLGWAAPRVVPLLDLSAGTPSGERLVEYGVEWVLGDGRWTVFAAFVLLAGPLMLTRGAPRRAVLTLELAFLALFHPGAAEGLVSQILGVASSWRIFWLLPFPALLAAVLTAPLLVADRGGRTRWIGQCVTAILVPTALLGLGSVPLVSPANGTRFGWPFALEVPAEDYEAARLLVESVPRGSRVAAPEAVATWIPTFPGHPVPLVTRERYLRFELPPREIERRRAVTAATAGEGPAKPLLLALQEDTLAGVVLDGWVAISNERSLVAGGLHHVGDSGRWSVWAAPTSDSPVSSR